MLRVANPPPHATMGDEASSDDRLPRGGRSGERQKLMRADHALLDRNADGTRSEARRGARRADGGVLRERAVEAHCLLLPAVVVEVHAVAEHVVDRQRLGAVAETLAAVRTAVAAEDLAI